MANFGPEKLSSDVAKKKAANVFDRISAINDYLYVLENESETLGPEEKEMIRGFILEHLDVIEKETNALEGKNVSFFNERVYAKLKAHFPEHAFFKDNIDYVNHLELLESGEVAFKTIKEKITSAKHSIEIQMFLWRDDKVGREMIDLLLQKARDGVEIRISKDALGTVFELSEKTKKSMFHRLETTPDYPALQDVAEVIESSYGEGAEPTEPTKQVPYPPLQELLDLPNVTVIAGCSQHNHSKYYLIDERTLILGDMNVGTEYTMEWRNFMTMAEDSPLLVAKFRARSEGSDQIDEGTSVEFGLNRFGLKKNATQKKVVEIPEIAINLITRAKEKVVIEMAYFGNPDIGKAIQEALDNEVEVTIVVPEKANVLQNLNNRFIAELMEYAKENNKEDLLHVYSFPGMLHAKVLQVDDRVSFLGSANYTPTVTEFQESNFLIDDVDAPFTLELKSELEKDIKKSKKLTDIPSYDAVLAYKESLNLIDIASDLLSIKYPSRAPVFYSCVEPSQ